MDLKAGSKGEDVRTLQLLLLMTTVAAPGPPDGIFGRMTLAAVRRAREALGLPSGGEAAHLQGIWVNNLGNIDAVPPWRGPVFWLRAPEVLGGRRSPMTKALRAYASLEEGAVGYWQRLAEGYAGALPFFEAGDPVGAAWKLKELRWYTGSAEDYAAAMRDRFEALGAVGM